MIFFEADKLEAQTASDAVQADSRNPLRILQYLTLLCFTLPWLTVSCSGSQVSSVSGAAIASGSFLITNPLDHVVTAVNLTPNPFVLAIFIAAIAVLYLIDFGTR